MKIKNSILIVDDNESILRILILGLEKYGFEVFAAKSAQEARNIASEFNFQFALLDIRLPDGNGIELSLDIKSNDPSVIVILMTGYPEIQNAIEALRYHVYDYLIKPLKIVQVIRVIEKAKSELRLIGENRYSAELIRALKEENEQLKSMLNELMPNEVRLQKKSLNKFKSTSHSQEDILRLYSKNKRRII